MQTLLLIGLLIALGLLPFAYLFRGVRVEIAFRQEDAFLTKLEDQLAGMNYGLNRQEDEIRVYTPPGGGKLQDPIYVQLVGSTAVISGPSLRVTKLQNRFQTLTSEEGVTPPQPGEDHSYEIRTSIETGQLPSDAKQRRERSRLVAVAAVAAAIATFFCPTLMLVTNGGEICTGYQVDVGGYYAKLVPLALVGAIVGAVIGYFLFQVRTNKRGIGCGIAVLAIGGLGCMVISFMVAIFPGC